jgi:phenylalanyl-tRNA synthetase beta chain
MKISRQWLQKYFDSPLPEAEKLADALTFHAFEIESTQKVGNDDVIDVKVTPNRGHDALSHRGIAKEISAILNLPLSSDPLADGHSTSGLEPVTEAVSVTIDTELCQRITLGYIKGVKVGPSPEWLKARLEAIGQRSINNVVDATNFVMFNIGQPVHAFDAGQLAATTQGSPMYSLEVRTATAGEVLLALDDKEYKLSPSNLVVSDKNSGKAVGIAGVKGGKPAGVTEATKDIIVECANFDGVSVRRTSKALNLSTDASQRFQQVISPVLAAFGQRSAVDLILKIAGGELIGFVDVYPKPTAPWQVTVTASQISKLLGVEIPTEEIKATLARLGFVFTEAGGNFTVDIPFERLDLTISEDLIEEVGRLIGYERIPAIELSPYEKLPEINQNFAAAERVRKDLTDLGYSEVFTPVFADKGEIAVLNKVDSVRPYLRATLTDGLNDALKKNLQNKDLLGLKEIKLFEIGTVWKGGAETTMASIVSEKESAKEDPLSLYVKETTEYDALPLSDTERYTSFSRFPSITRDIALWVPAGSHTEEVRSVIAEAAGGLLIRIDQFDEFQKGDKTSFAYRLVFQSFDKTLTDEEANAAMQSVYNAVKSRSWEVR